ncbi:MAG: type II toxin-antitoxin system VapC family toxin [Thermoleophilaceae bacterium]
MFADSSALVKLYADEPHAEEVRAVAGLIVATLTRVEVPAALWRKHRMGELSVEDTAALVRAFEVDWLGRAPGKGRFAVVVLTDRMLEEASGLCATDELRGYDAIQLASAQTVRAAEPGCASFACFDRQLRSAAARRGFALVPAG